MRAYYFNEAPVVDFYPDIADWGPFRGTELPFVFGTTMEYYSGPEQALSKTCKTPGSVQ